MTVRDVTDKRGAAPRHRKPSVVKEVWRNIRRPLANSAVVKHGLARLVSAGLRFVDATNRRASGSSDVAAALRANGPAIYTVWHGQHLMYPTLYANAVPVDVMVSRSSDAELNALVLEKFGVGTVRGSGGRGSKKALEKGGARALIALKKSLDAGRSVAMVADIPNGTPRDAGLGIVTLARISGRPIYPVAYATSRRKIVERSWDKMAINLPFGRSAVLVGDPIHVPADANEEELERMRQVLTHALNALTTQVYALADGESNQQGAGA